jgi:hypothetical protein
LSPCGPAGPRWPVSELTAFGLSLFVSSERFLTSLPVIVPSLMLLPVTVTAA